MWEEEEERVWEEEEEEEDKIVRKREVKCKERGKNEC